MEIIKQRFAEHIMLARQVADSDILEQGRGQCRDHQTGLAGREEGAFLRQRRQCG